MENYMSNPMETSMDHAESIEKMYPDAYIRVYPHVQFLVSSLSEERIVRITMEDVEQLTQEAMRRSNVINDPPPGHSIHTMGDMTRAMVVRDLRDRDRRRGFFPFFPPFFFFPFEERRERFRDFDRDREHERDRGHRY